MKLKLETYTPAEAEAITAVKQATVRNWRRAGHLPRQEGHARYNLADMLVMFVMGMLVSRGTTPEAAKEFASETARAIFQSTICSMKAFSEGVHAMAKAELGEISEEEISPFKARFGAEFRIETLEFVRSQEIMIKAAEQMAGVAEMKHPSWLIIWADGGLEFLFGDEDEDDDFFGNIQHGQPYVQGPVMLFCLGALAQMVIDRLPRPAIRLDEEGQ
ncbi:MerR family transcriptional regulator [Salipiger sp. 1_MG-2023]|uniref:MerR family transcriptional regulator n=1 Tax=Salipiger sp. 1_MG-2023 TaxID=3062665 RepID=UPI0026E28706|nr:MerR family transcriptional regulator [Salipiger sp. 1_MG-2023]MDO6585246.1 MerR family transcriptional regulator [Salipiger sp. 1_MG-2023]